MKRIIFAFFLVPQLAFGQYNSKCFTLEQTGNLRKEIVGVTIDKSIEKPSNCKSAIYGLFVSGSVTLDNNQDSYVRIILKDDYNYEHLVYECYPLLADDLRAEFDNTAMETVTLDGIIPQSLIIVIKNAKINFESYSLLPSKPSADNVQKTAAEIQKEQCQYIAAKMNENLEKRNLTWRAKVSSISTKSYEEKKDMFGGIVPELYGFDYYGGGVFVMPDSQYNQNVALHRDSTTVQYVSEWDWRDRHGKNWMTDVEKQGICNSCWIFAAVGSLEAYINLYYNQIATYINSDNEQQLEYDLSEQEIMTCLENNYCLNRGTPAKALNYIKNNGVVNEECFRYVGHDMDCTINKCTNPAERVYIENYDTIPDGANEEYVKTKLFRSPLPFSISSWEHSMVLAGYKTLAVGDIIRTGEGHSTITISDSIHHELVGQTAWLFKNSWGKDWGEENGYAYAVVDTYNRYYTNSLLGRVTCMQHTDSDIVCEDADGDGYYFWGIGPKPAHCPSWAPDDPDGDDSNINYGPIDSCGVLFELPNGITIDSLVIYSTNNSTSYRLGIVNGGILTITGTTTLTGYSKIRVCEGGILIVDGGTLQDADLEMVPGSTLIVRNNGIINMATGKEFNAPKGTNVVIENGEIN